MLNITSFWRRLCINGIIAPILKNSNSAINKENGKQKIIEVRNSLGTTNKKSDKSFLIFLIILYKLVAASFKSAFLLKLK